jgi:hypothetical protein
MSRRAAFAVCALSVVLTLISLFTIGVLQPPNQNQNEIDTSWISELEEYLNEAQPYPPPPSDWDLSSYYVYLFEDGKEYLVEYSGDETNLVTFLEDLIDKADVKIGATISEGFVNRITASDKVASLTYRFPSFAPSSQLKKAWFILQDNLNEGLTGTMVLAQTINNKEELSAWVIPK